MESIRSLFQLHPLSDRWSKLFSFISDDFPDLGGILICDGDDDANSIKIKTLSLQSYLFRFEFTNSVMLFTREKLIFFSSKSKSKFIREFQLTNEHEVSIIEFSEKNPIDEDFNQLFSQILELDLGQIGFFKKETQTGKMATTFMKKANNFLNLIDYTSNIQMFLSVKESKDLQLVRGSANLTQIFFKNMNEEVEEIIDSGKEVRHCDLSDKIETILDRSRHKTNQFGLNGKFYDFAYAPVIQSSGRYNLRPTAENSTENLTSDCILLNMCGKYFEMNCLVVRTLLVNPREKEKRFYNALYYLHNKVIENLISGRQLAEVYTKSRISFKEKFAGLEKHLPLHFGFGIGFEFKERCLAINGTNLQLVKPNQVYAVVTSLEGLIGFKGNKNFSMQIADTVIVLEKGQLEVVTMGISKSLEEVGYDFEEEMDPVNNHIPTKPKVLSVHGNYMSKKLKELEEKSKTLGENKRLTRAAMRREKIEQENTKKELRERNQRRLLEEKMQEVEDRYNKGTFISKNDLNKKIKVCDLEVYTQDTYPEKLETQNARLDRKQWTLLLPIHGKIIPFHVCLLKNIIKQQEEDVSRVRFNFFYPGIACPGLDFSLSEDLNESKPIYLQELTFKSTNHESVGNLVKKVKELKKKWIDRKETFADPNERLDLGKKIHSLDQLKMRPTLSGKKTKGMLSGYKQGFKFVSKKGDIFELSHDNIKHAIYQPCDENMIIILHFCLKKPMLLKSKRVKNVQFYCEVGALAEDLNEPRRTRGYYNQNEMEEEEMDMEFQQKFNEMFLTFVDKMRRDSNCPMFETPNSAYSFFGSPFYNNVLVTPCENSLVSIIDTPLFVMSLEDVEIVSFERIENKIKNFDVVFIFKDYSRPVQTISNISKNKLELIKEWLDSENLLYFDIGKMNIKWEFLLKRIRVNPEKFIFEEGGWRGFFEDSSDEDSVNGRGADDESVFDEADFEGKDSAEDSELDDLDDDEDSEEEFYREEEEEEEEEEDWDSEDEYEKNNIEPKHYKKKKQK